MPLESGLIAYGALTQLAISRKKHRPKQPMPGMLAPTTARALGIALTILSLAVAMLRFGAAQGVVAWTGELCIAGALFVLLLSWRDRLALMIGLTLPLLALPFLLL